MRLKLLMLLSVVAAISLSACTFVVDPSQMGTELVAVSSPTPLVMETAADHHVLHLTGRTIKRQRGTRTALPGLSAGQDAARRHERMG
jgi:hypothetical protein